MPLRVTRNMGPVADTRNCEHCDAVFEPRREHARFCSPRCRVAWNRENINGQWAGDSALGWAIIAMRDTAHRLGRIRSKDRPQAFAVIGEAVWWVTIVDATLVRYHSEAYDNALAGQAHDEGARQPREPSRACGSSATRWVTTPITLTSSTRAGLPAAHRTSRSLRGHGSRCRSRPSDGFSRAGRNGR